MSAELPLEDIVLPPVPDAWPPGPAWWLLAAILSMTLVGLAVAALAYRRRTAVRREALKQVKQLAYSAEFEHQINALLKQASLGYFSRQHIAALHGSAWWAFLQRQLPERQHDKIRALKNLTDGNRFQARKRRQRINPEQLKQAAQFWIRHALPPRKKQEETC